MSDVNVPAAVRQCKGDLEKMLSRVQMVSSGVSWTRSTSCSHGSDTTLFVTPCPAGLAPCFADDGLLAGPSAEVLRALRRLLAVMPSVGLRFSSLAVAAAAGPHHQINFDPFLEAGCSISGAGDLEVLKSPIGSETFCADSSRKLVDKQLVAVHAVGQLPDAQVGYYLLRYSCSASRVCYLSRTTPASHCLHALCRFDSGVQAAFEDLGWGFGATGLGTGHIACEGRWPRPTTRRLCCRLSVCGLTQLHLRVLSSIVG